jgi:hypothetical protein
MLLIAQQYMIQQWAIAGQETASDIERHRMPKFTLLRLPLYRKVFEFTYLILQLNNESDFSRSAEISDDQKADDLQEGLTGEALFVQADLGELFLLDGSDLHNVPYVQVLDPFCLIQESEDVAKIDSAGFYLFTLDRMLAFVFSVVLVSGSLSESNP